jgi:hypothetical protein
LSPGQFAAKGGRISMSRLGPTDDGASTLLAAIGQLSGAQDDLTRLSALLNDAFNELLTSFRVVQLVAVNGGNMLEIERSANRAITALQCGDLADQLIGFTQKRLVFVRESLKIERQMPQTVVTQATRYVPTPAAAETGELGPVRQNAAEAGTIEQF